MTSAEPTETVVEADARLLRLYVAARERQAELLVEVAAACPGPHRPVQHRDARPPWCPSCGRTAYGLRVDRSPLDQAQR